MHIEELIDRRPFGSFQLRLAVLCGLVLFMAGFNAQLIGYVIPTIAEAWRITPAGFTPVVASGLTGMMIGAMTLGPAGDRIGRRPVLIGCTLWFGIWAVLTATASSTGQLAFFRFVDGVGI